MQLKSLTVMAVFAAFASAQTFPRRAVFTQGGSPDRGKCTVEVVVDGAAEVEIRGDNAILRNLAGQPPQWRRFECNGPMPANPRDFRFAGVDGRGRQELIQDPRNSRGVAVVRIEDKDNGSEGYTFDIFWSNGPGDSRPPDRGDFDRGPGRRFTVDQAVRVCQDAVAQQASDRFRTRDINFRRTTIDDNPGRNDWVVGSFDVRRFNRMETYRFSCSVDFDNGRVRSAQIEDGGPGPGPGPDGARRAIDSCRRAVDERLHRDGYDNVDFDRIDVDNRPGRNDWIVGIARADSRNIRREAFDFSCSVNLRDGDIRSVDVSRR